MVQLVPKMAMEVVQEYVRVTHTCVSEHTLIFLPAGIMHVVETSAVNREHNMTDALQDLEALMVKAKDMVRLAAELNERLTASSTTTSATNNP